MHTLAHAHTKYMRTPHARAHTRGVECTLL